MTYPPPIRITYRYDEPGNWLHIIKADTGRAFMSFHPEFDESREGGKPTPEEMKAIIRRQMGSMSLEFVEVVS